MLVLVVAAGAALLVPMALRAQAAQREAFLSSFGRPLDELAPPPLSPRSRAVARRRRIAAVLLAGMAGTGLAGLVPSMRPLLFAHLFLDDAFLAYVALLALQADRRSAAAPTTASADETRPADRRGVLPRPVMLDLPPMAPAG